LGKKVALGLVVGRNFDFFKKDLEDIKDRVGTFLPCNTNSFTIFPCPGLWASGLVRRLEYLVFPLWGTIPLKQKGTSTTWEYVNIEEKV
jgi:hypothetical protein